MKTIFLILALSMVALATPGDHFKKGQTLPKISETDQHGKVRTLDSLKGPNGTLLVVYRSADW